MVAAVVDRLRELVHGDVGRRDVGVAEAEVDHVVTASPGLGLQPVDDGEDIRRKTGDAAKLHPGRLLKAHFSAVPQIGTIEADERGADGARVAARARLERWAPPDGGPQP